MAHLVLGELNADKADLTMAQRIRRKVLRLHLAKLNWPRFIWGPLRFMDYMKREQSMYYDWTNEDHYNIMNMSDKPTFEAPGFKELGVSPQCILPTVHESAAGYYVSDFLPVDNYVIGKYVLRHWALRN